MRFPALLLAAALAAAPAAAQPASAPPVAGTYHLVEINGQPLTPETEGEPGWIVEGATIVLHEDGRLTLEARAHKRGEPVQTRSAPGRYTVEGQEVVVRLDDAPDVDRNPMRFTLRDGVLTGRDSNGASMAFRRT